MYRNLFMLYVLTKEVNITVRSVTRQIQDNAPGTAI